MEMYREMPRHDPRNEPELAGLGASEIRAKYLERNLDQVPNSWAFDQNGGTAWLHFNAGVVSPVWIESFRQGFRGLTPFLPLDLWPTKKTELGGFLEGLVLMFLQDQRFPAGMDLKFYMPPISSISNGFCAREVLAMALKNFQSTVWYRDRKLGLQIIPVGRPLEIA